MCYEILILCCLAALTIGLLNLKALGKNPYVVLKYVVSLLVSFTMLRYVTLIIYGGVPEYQLLQSLRYFYFSSSVGITMTTASAIWYITPCYREKIRYPYFIACFTPWILFDLYIILKQPTEIIQGSQFGYQLMLSGSFPYYLSIMQGSLVVILSSLCLIGIMRYKHLQIRTQLFLILLAQVLLALDGLGYRSQQGRIFPAFTVTEAFSLITTYYAFSKTIKVIRALKSQ